MAITEESLPIWSQGITGPAVDIAGADSRRLHVAAGPGTGKTTAIMRRVARLLDEGVEPSRVLIVTFTRTAARDLLRELQTLGAPGCHKVEVGTLHSFCMKVLMRHDVFSQTGRSPRPLFDFEKRIMIDDVKGDNRSVDGCKELLTAFQAGWARLQSDVAGWPHNPNEQDFQRELLAWLRFHEAMLLEEIIIETRNYLQNSPFCREREAYDHVIVDEYQDLNRADQGVIDLLAESGSLTVVGDEDQAIFSVMRFAQPESMREFPERHPDTLSLSLRVCRRCPSRIVKIANHLIAYNRLRESRELEIDPANGQGSVQVIQWRSMANEAQGIAQIIQERVEAGDLDLRDFLVLVPRRQQGYAIGDALKERGILSHSFFYDEELRTTQAKEQFTLLSLHVNPTDAVSLRTWIGLRGSESLSRSYRRVRLHCDANDLVLSDVLNDIHSGKVKLPYTNAIVSRLDALYKANANLEGLTGRELIDAVFPDCEELRLIRRVALEVQKDSEAPLSAGELLDGVRDLIIYPEPPPIDDYVRIMSLHKSKGLAAKMVIVAECIQGALPSRPRGTTASEKEREIEEQRRLFYVAITRARESLVISSFASAPLDSARKQGLDHKSTSGNSRRRTVPVNPSQFLTELGPEAPVTVARGLD